ncbi:MAG: acyltransferase [Oscillospiraceae bacterium]|nr:acyltransferase [Oscillospiraceae bacterium]
MKDQIKYISVIRVIACISVVVLHTFYASASYAVNEIHSIICLSVRNLMMWAVPGFVMVSGVLLLDGKREVGLKKIFSKYIMKLFLCLICFSLIFALFDMAFVSKDISIDFIKNGLTNAFKGTGWSHLWYLYMMIAIYLLLPVYRIVSRNITSKELDYFLVVLALFLSVVPVVNKVINMDIPFYICIYTIYPFYLFLGYRISQVKVPVILSVGLLIAGVIAVCVITALNFKNRNDLLSLLLENYSSPLIVVISFSAFSLLKNISSIKNNILNKSIMLIDKCSLGIYLIHMAVLKYIAVSLKIDPFKYGGTAFICLEALAVFLVSLLLTYIWIWCTGKIIKKQK